MPNLTDLPLDQLIRHCPPLTQTHTSAAAAVWAELQRRALLEQSDAAWDALVLLLWPPVLTWIYARVPDIPPAAAEQLAQQTIWTLRQQQTVRLAAHGFHHTALTAQIFRILLNLLPNP